MCKKGSRGPLCSLCDPPQYYLEAASGECRHCRTEWTTPVLILLGFLVFCATLILMRAPISRWAERNESWLPKFLEKLIIFIITMQVHAP